MLLVLPLVAFCGERERWRGSKSISKTIRNHTKGRWGKKFKHHNYWQFIMLFMTHCQNHSPWPQIILYSIYKYMKRYIFLILNHVQLYFYSFHHHHHHSINLLISWSSFVVKYEKKQQQQQQKRNHWTIINSFFWCYFFSKEIHFSHIYLCGYKFNNRFTTHNTSVNRICGEEKKGIEREIKKIDYIARMSDDIWFLHQKTILLQKYEIRWVNFNFDFLFISLWQWYLYIFCGCHFPLTILLIFISYKKI